MARETFKLTGFSDLEAKLKELPANVAKRAVFRAMRRAANVMAEELRSRTPQGPTGNLRDSIIVKARARNTAGFAEYADVMQGGGSFKEASAALRSARVGGAKGASRVIVTIGSTAPHAHLVEFGTVERFHKSGKSTGMMPMNPFVRPAWDAKADTCLQAIKDELTAEILRIEGKGPKIKASEAGLIDG